MNIDADIEATLRLAHLHAGIRPIAFNSAGIKAAVQPSNLTAPTRLSEKYAPDSCVTGLELKYVYADRELLSAKPRELVLRQATEEGMKGGKDREIDINLGVKSMIPGLILYERPSWSRSEALESLLGTSVPQSLASTAPYISSEQPKPEPPKALQAPRPAKSATPKQKTIKRVQVQIAQPQPSDSITRPEAVTRAPHYSAPRKLHSKGKKKQEKTQKVYSKPKSPESPSISEQFALSDSINRWSEAKNSASFKEKDEFSPSKSGSLKESSPETRYEDARTTKHVHYQDDSIESRPHPEESIRQLEEMVAEQHRYLVEHGYLSPQSSMTASRQKTYEDLEREIESIKDMLGEREQPGEESGSALSYSSDEGEEEGEEWMSPRFTE